MLCAVSGGADSLALAHALHTLPRPLRLIHINHHLHADSDRWALAVQDFARGLSLDMLVHDVDIDDRANVEARARDARYAAIFAAAKSDEVVLTAHHQDDQAATLLLQLLRGAGVAGLAAMPADSHVRGLRHVRPVLDVPAAQLRAYGAAHGLEPIDDPGNDDLRFDRNYLTHNVIPQLVARWPAYARTLARSAQHCAAADALLQEQAALDTPLDDHWVDISVARIRTDERASNALRTWLRQQAIERPADARMKEFVRQVRTAASDATPQLDLGGVTLRACAGVVFVTGTMASLCDWQQPLVGDQSVELPENVGRLTWTGAPTPDAGLHIRFRRGGERFGQQPTRRLKTWLQAQRVLPWQRGRVPLVFAADELVAIGDWWQSERLGGAIRWETSTLYRLGRAKPRVDLRAEP